MKRQMYATMLFIAICLAVIQGAQAAVLYAENCGFSLVDGPDISPANRTLVETFESGFGGNFTTITAFNRTPPGIFGNYSAKSTTLLGNLQVNASAVFSNPSEFTMSVWLNISESSAPPYNPVILEGYASTNDNNPVFMFGLAGYGNCTASTDNLCIGRFYLTNVEGCGFNYSQYFDTPTQVVMRVNGTHGKAYVNGEEKCSLAWATPFNVTSWQADTVKIAGYPGYTRALNGSVDNLEIFNRGLTSAEILGMYQRDYTVLTNIMACNDTVEVRCDIRATSGGIPPVEVTNAEFTIGGRQYSAVRVNGNNTNGTWAVNVTPEGLGGISAVSLSSLVVRNSIGTVCSFNPSENNLLFETDTCYMQFTPSLSVRMDCPCTVVETNENVVGSPNTCRVTATPSFGCADRTVASSVVSCDWCNPNWQVEYTYCSVDLESSTPFAGIATKKYTGNVSCCEMSGLAEDCVPPIDADVTVPCLLDYSTTGGIDSVGSNAAQKKGSKIVDPELYSSSVQAARLYPGGPVMRPLVFDIDSDGVTEIVVFEEAAGLARAKVYDDARLQSVQGIIYFNSSSGPVRWRGQPSLYGFSAYGIGKYAWDEGVQNGTYGVGIAAVVNDSVTNQDKFGTWRWENGTFVWKAGLTLTAQGHKGGVGVNCFVNTCYFMDKGGNFYKADAPYTSSTIKTPAAMGVTVPANDYVMDSLPVMMVFNESALPVAVGVEGFQQVNGTNVASLFVCDDGLVGCVDVPYTRLEPGNISRLVTGIHDGGLGAIYFTSQEVTNTPGQYDGGKIWATKFNETAFVVESIAYKVLVASGGTLTKVSDPAAATCVGGGKGVALVSHWVNDLVEYNEYACYTMS